MRSHRPLVGGQGVVCAESGAESAATTKVAPRSHGNTRRDHLRWPATGGIPRHYTETRMSRPPPHVHGKEGVVVALALPSEIHSRAGPRGSRPHRALFATWATAHPALIPHEAPGNPRPHPRIPAMMRAQALLTRQIPAYPRSGRKHHDRPVTPEVAGSSPVAPVLRTKSLQI